MIFAGLLMRTGLGQKAAGVLSYVLVAALLLGALWLYGNGRYNAGVRDTDDKWELAGKRLQEKAQKSGQQAGQASVVRQQTYQAKVADERRRIDEMQQTGGSPFDVVFGSTPPDNGSVVR
jgi:hypothetical protein